MFKNSGFFELAFPLALWIGMAYLVEGQTSWVRSHGGTRSAPQVPKPGAGLASIIRTAQQQGRNALETIKILLRATWAEKISTH